MPPKRKGVCHSEVDHSSGTELLRHFVTLFTLSKVLHYLPPEFLVTVCQMVASVSKVLIFANTQLFCAISHLH